MKSSIGIACAAALFGLVASPASAAVSSAQALGQVTTATPIVTRADFVQGHETIAGFGARSAKVRAETSAVMAQRYFDVDALITLGALALASGAFVAVGIAGGRRRAAVRLAPPREGWREDVMRALEADLDRFAVGLREAA